MLNKKEFQKSKQAIDLHLISVDQIIISGKFKYSDDGFKYFIGYKEDEIVRTLWIILSQMIWKGESISFLINNDSVLVKYNEIWSMIKKTLNIKFRSMPVYDEKCIKSKLREFNGVNKTNL